MNLNLERPLAFFDLETTGINIATDRIVEIAIVKVHPDNSRETYTKRINPGIPIPLEISEIHGIYDIDLIDSPKFADVAGEIKDFLEGADLAGYNSNRFDIPVIVEEMLRVNIDLEIEKRKLVDVQNVFHKMEKRTLEAAYKFYCDKELVNAHSAEADTIATLEVMEAQLDRYASLENNIDFLEEFSTMGVKTYDFAKRIAFDDNDDPIFNFGKHKGRTVKSVFTKEPAYFKWIMKGDFSRDTKNKFKKIKEEMA